MKRKITLLLTLTLWVTSLCGCGSKEIAFSELFENDVIIYSTPSEESFKGKDERISRLYVCGADGTFYEGPAESMDLGDCAQMSDEELIQKVKDYASSDVKKSEVTGKYKLKIETDLTGNSTDTESILSQVTTIWRNGNENVAYDNICLKTFVGHVTIYDSSYMLFEYTGKSKKRYYLIRDTKKTKDKTVYFDEVGTDGIVVDMSAKEVFE